MDRSVFISYAREDSGAVHYDADLLRAGGVRVFIDVRDIEFGARWRDALTQAIQACERVLVFWSAAARMSEWVEREWRLALELGKKIVPTLLDTTPLPDELGQFQAVRRYGKPRRRARARRDADDAPSAISPPTPMSAPPGAPPSARSRGWLPGALAACVVGGVAWYALMSDRQAPDDPPIAVPPVPPASAPEPLPAPSSMVVLGDVTSALVGLAVALAILVFAYVVVRRRRSGAARTERLTAPAPEHEAQDFVREVFSA